MSPLKTIVKEFNATLTPLDWEERLIRLRNVQLHMAFSTSFSLEDQAITHVIATQKLPVRMFAIDTGRLFEETLETFAATQNRYAGLEIETYYPDAAGVQELVQQQGINGFYNSLENRHACCHMRKVEPLKRALAGVDVWISGLRREHSATRGDLPVAQFDASRNLVKLYPLIDCPEGTIKPYIAANNIPTNPLHERGYPSIGCAPCTRAVKPGEHARAGRWWWEQDKTQECGLHLSHGQLVRAKDVREEEAAA